MKRGLVSMKAFLTALSLLLFTLVGTAGLASGVGAPSVPPSLYTSSSNASLQSGVSEAVSIPSSTVSATKTAAVAAKPAAIPVDTFAQQIASIKAAYAIDISTSSGAASKLSNASWTNISSNDSDARTFVTMLNREISKYPASFVSRSGLKKIYIVKDLRVEGQYRSAMPEPVYEDAVYYDVSAKYLKSDSGNYMRRVIHHEYEHLIEYNLFGTYYWQDSVWKGCNVPGFQYGAGGASAYSNASFANAWHPQTGFVTGYATYGIEEDKAEVFAWAMFDSSKLKTAASSDANLQCKVNRLIQNYQISLLP